MLHAQKLIEGYGPATVLDALLAGGQTDSSMPLTESTGADGAGQDEGQMEGSDPTEITGSDDEAEPVLPELPVPANGMDIPSMGLW